LIILLQKPQTHESKHCKKGDSKEKIIIFDKIFQNTNGIANLQRHSMGIMGSSIFVAFETLTK
jgi:hypothetical protein